MIMIIMIITVSCELSITDFACLPHVSGGSIEHYCYWVHEIK